MQTGGGQEWSLSGHERPFRTRYSKFPKGRFAAVSYRSQLHNRKFRFGAASSHLPGAIFSDAKVDNRPQRDVHLN